MVCCFSAASVAIAVAVVVTVIVTVVVLMEGLLQWTVQSRRLEVCFFEGNRDHSGREWVNNKD